MRNNCEYCDAPLNEGAKFCSNCGAPVKHMQKGQFSSIYTEQVDFDQDPLYDMAYESKPLEVTLYKPDKDIKSMFMRHDNRLNRQRFILRSLGNFIAMFVIAVVLFSIAEISQSAIIYWLASIVSLMFMIPSFMLIIRRLHDLNRSGWWCVGMMIPVVNIVFAIYLVLFAGTNGPNRYGPDPLYKI